MKKHLSGRLVSICAALVCLALLSVTAFALQNQDNPSWLWGNIERKYQNGENLSNAGTPAIVGKHFTISAEELNHTIEVQKLIDPDTAEEIAKNLLIEKYSLYYQAQEAGVIVSDEYLDDLIEKNISVFSEAMSTNEDYAAFLEGIGMTNEEYWYSCKDQLRMNESIAAWKDMKHREFIKGNGYDVDPPDNLDTLWAEYLNRLTSEMIAQEDIKYLEKDKP